MSKLLALLLMIISTTLTFAQAKTKGELYAPLYALYYPTNQWELTEENSNFLDLYVVQGIEKTDAPHCIIYLEGHTDAVGNADYNQQLSQKRVQTVADYLISKGFSVDQIKVSYFGASKPETRAIAVSNKPKDIRHANRRVTIRIEIKV